VDEIRGVAHFATQHCEKLHLLRFSGRGLGEGTDEHQPSQWLVTSCLRKQWVPHGFEQEYEDVEDEGTDARRRVSLAKGDKCVQHVLMKEELEAWVHGHGSAFGG